MAMWEGYILRFFYAAVCRFLCLWEEGRECTRQHVLATKTLQSLLYTVWGTTLTPAPSVHAAQVGESGGWPLSATSSHLHSQPAQRAEKYPFCCVSSLSIFMVTAFSRCSLFMLENFRVVHPLDQPICSRCVGSCTADSHCGNLLLL